MFPCQGLGGQSVVDQVGVFLHRFHLFYNNFYCYKIVLFYCFYLITIFYLLFFCYIVFMNFQHLKKK